MIRQQPKKSDLNTDRHPELALPYFAQIAISKKCDINKQKFENCYLKNVNGETTNNLQFCSFINKETGKLTKVLKIEESKDPRTYKITLIKEKKHNEEIRLRENLEDCLLDYIKKTYLTKNNKLNDEFKTNYETFIEIIINVLSGDQKENNFILKSWQYNNAHMIEFILILYLQKFFNIGILSISNFKIKEKGFLFTNINDAEIECTIKYDNKLSKLEDFKILFKMMFRLFEYSLDSLDSVAKTISIYKLTPAEICVLYFYLTEKSYTTIKNTINRMFKKKNTEAVIGKHIFNLVNKLNLEDTAKLHPLFMK